MTAITEFGRTRAHARIVSYVACLFAYIVALSTATGLLAFAVEMEEIPKAYS